MFANMLSLVTLLACTVTTQTWVLHINVSILSLDTFAPCMLQRSLAHSKTPNNRADNALDDLH